MTWLLFPIGMFPAIMIVATLLFFPPDWPRRWMPTRGIDVTPERHAAAHTSRWMVAPLVLHVAIQIAVPLRAYWPGADPDWTGRGFNFGWRVMIAEKAGSTELIARDRLTGRRWHIPIRDYATERQEKMMAQDPSMIRALARHVAEDYRARGLGDLEVSAESFAALNGRPLQRLIDPRVDLAGPTAGEWIVPREQRGLMAAAELTRGW
jgi:vitamin K-dependent gamma-carboxylase